MNDTPQVALRQGQEVVFKEATALMHAISSIKALTERDKCRALALVADAAGLIFKADAQPAAMAAADPRFQAFKAQLLAKPKRTRKARSAA